MNRNYEVIEKLKDQALTIDKSASVYWRESLEGFNFNNGDFVSKFLPEGKSKQRTIANRLINYILGAPFRYLYLNGEVSKRVFNDAKEIFAKRKSIITLGALRQVIALSFIRANIALESLNSPILVIGDGFGIMTALLHSSLMKKNKVIAINLTQNLLVDAYSILESYDQIEIALVETSYELKCALADDAVSIIFVRADDLNLLKDIQVGLAINISSMQEMEYPIISKYFDILRSSENSDTYFYNSNRLSKRLQNGDIIEFMSYPWHKDDEILVDEIVPWHKYYYSIIPPFYHKYDGKHHHRLAKLSKRSNS